MILFQQDWRSHQGAIVDTQTTNRSFVRLAALYKQMGIKNHLFILALLNPELQGVDPFSPDLTIEQQAAIAVECKQNFWYYAREIARVPGSANGRVIRFIANRGNISMFWLYLNHITLILTQIRQTGKSFSSDVLSTWLLNIACVNTTINLLTKDDTLRAANLERLKALSDELPYYLRQRNKNDVSNTEELTVNALKNRYSGHLPNKSPKMALNVGRGLTSPNFLIDEVAFLSNIGISLPAALAGGTNARVVAKENGDPYGTIMTTTAGKKDDRDGKFAFQLVSNSAPWSEKLLDAKDLDTLELLVRKSSPNGELRVCCTFNHRQLGYTDEWLKRTLEEAIVSGEAADRDFFNIWTSGSMSSPIPVKIVEAIRAAQVNDCFVDISPSGYTTRWYIHESAIESTLAKSQFVLAMDTSEASGGDDISLILTDIRTGGVIAAGSYNETNLISFAMWITEWFVKYPNITGIIERRSTGGMLLDYLMLMLPAKNIDPFKRLFNRVVNDSDQDRERFLDVKEHAGTQDEYFYTKYKKTFGFSTSGSGITSRSELYSITLQAAAKNIGGLIKDPKTIDQMVSLTTRNGRIDHQEGGHDDMVIAILLGYWFITQGKNLAYYGIDSSVILCDAKRLGDSVENRMSDYERHEQAKIRHDMEELYNKMSKADDEYVYRRYEMLLRNLNNRIILGSDETFSLDSLLESLEKEKRFTRYSDKPKATMDMYQPRMQTVEFGSSLGI